MPSDPPEPAPGERSRFLRFIATSGVAAAVNIGSAAVLGSAISYPAAISVAFLLGMTTAFALARIFVFAENAGAVHAQYLRFAIVNAVAFAQVWLVSIGLAFIVFPHLNLTWHADTIAHAIGVASPIVTSYFGHRHFSFRQERG